MLPIMKLIPRLRAFVGARVRELWAHTRNRSHNVWVVHDKCQLVVLKLQPVRVKRCAQLLVRRGRRPNDGRFVGPNVVSETLYFVLFCGPRDGGGSRGGHKGWAQPKGAQGAGL